MEINHRGWAVVVASQPVPGIDLSPGPLFDGRPHALRVVGDDFIVFHVYEAWCFLGREYSYGLQ